MKIIHWISDNIFFVFSLFLLIFIPLYPKIPLIDIQHTWVYVRAEDFVVVFVLLLWIIFILVKKITLKTPLTFPILLFWIIGGIATLHGVLVIFPMTQETYSNIAFLSYLRRIEYLSLFFIAYQGIKDKSFLNYVIATVTITLFLVFLYGIGQKLFGFPAYLTMNEEFAKGVPLQLSQLSRIPSTFAGHYDLAAYLVLVIPLLISVAFGFKNYLVKFIILAVSFLGFILMFMTVSRVSFFVLFFSLAMLLLLQKKRLLLLFLLFSSFIFLYFSPSLLDRFRSTVSEIDVLVDLKTGEAIGRVKEVEMKYFEDKVVLNSFAGNEQDPKIATFSGVIPLDLYSPYQLFVVNEPNESTGENLPQGTGYINLPLSPVIGKTNVYFYQKSKEKKPGEAEQLFMFFGDYLIKRAKAYDLSFTTRFQGEWPNTIDAFKRNVFLGSGYGSVSLAVDNNYLRILGETGIFGFMSFALIFMVAGVYIKKGLSSIESPLVRNFIIGFVAGSCGLALNAIFIDVFEASKIAFTYWLLMGVTIGLIQLHGKEEIVILKELKNVLTSPLAVVLYFFILSAVLYYSASSYYFTGDDYTWFRWISDCCANYFTYFTEANGFFYRPGTKLYFTLMYNMFWLNPTMYHMASFLLHFLVASVLFLISQKIFKNYFLAFLTGVIFLIFSGHHEAIFWISATGFIFNALFALLSLLFFIYWKEKRSPVYLITSLIFVVLSLLFHERGVIVPFLIILYDVIFGKERLWGNVSKKLYYILYLFPLIPYLIIRFIAQSHWLSGDYSYNLLKLPYNLIGNTFGYIMLDLFGPSSLPIYQKLRDFSKEQLLLVTPLYIMILIISIVAYQKIIIRIPKDQRNIVIFGFLFFIVSLLPFLGFGNITSRYSYLSTAGIAMILPFVFQYLYFYLKDTNGKHLSLAGVSIAVIIFYMVHLFQLQKVEGDWKAAGERSKTFLISLDQRYSDGWKREILNFKFVNVPIRYGEAWVFPVGLKDAVWHVFQNDNISISQMTFDQAEELMTENEKIFVFQEDGSVKEFIRNQEKKLVPLYAE